MQTRQRTEPPEEPQRPVRRIILFFLALGSAIAVIVGLTAFLIYNSAARPRREGKAVAAGVTVKTFAQLQGDDVFPLGLAPAQDGSFYLTAFGSGDIVKISAQGTVTPWPEAKGKLRAGGAAALGPDQHLYVVDFSTRDFRTTLGTLRRISADGQTVAFGISPAAQPLTLPLFTQLAFDGSGNLYVADPASANIWQVPPSGNSVVWWTAPSIGTTRGQPTAIAYDAPHNAMIVGDAGTGTIYRLTVTSAPASNPLVLYRQASADIQSVAVDEQSRVLVAIWDHDNGQLARLEADGRLTILADNFRAPTSIVYRDSKIYLANSDLLGLVPPLFGFIPSPLHAKPPFTIDIVDVSGIMTTLSTGTPSSAALPQG